MKNHVMRSNTSKEALCEILIYILKKEKQRNSIYAFMLDTVKNQSNILKLLLKSDFHGVKDRY
jgi:hypothetical protein